MAFVLSLSLSAGLAYMLVKHYHQENMRAKVRVKHDERQTRL